MDELQETREIKKSKIEETPKERYIIFNCSDEKRILVEEKIANSFTTIRLLLEDTEGLCYLTFDEVQCPLDDITTEKDVPVQNVTSDVMKDIIEYCKYHNEHQVVTVSTEDEKIIGRADDILQWDKDFLGEDQEKIFNLLVSSNYLDFKPLKDLCCKTVANMIKGKTVAEIRSTFNIKNDFSPEEEAQVKKEHEWLDADDEEDKLVKN